MNLDQMKKEAEAFDKVGDSMADTMKGLYNTGDIDLAKQDASIEPMIESKQI